MHLISEIWRSSDLLVIIVIGEVIVVGDELLHSSQKVILEVGLNLDQVVLYLQNLEKWYRHNT